MIKKLKIGLLIIAVLAVFGLINSAKAVELTWTADTPVTIGSASYTIKSGSTADQVTVGATTLAVTVPSDSAFFEFESSDKYALSNDRGMTTQCDSDRTYLTITGPKVIVITPDTSSTPCDDGGGGGSGGSGGGKPKTPIIPAVPAVTTPPTDCLPGYLFSPSTGKSCNAATPATPASPALGAPGASGYAFGNGVVKLGTKGEACKAWQQFFNDKAGASLIVDGWCGKLTMATAKAWQASMGLVADGLLGAKSRAKANAQ